MVLAKHLVSGQAMLVLKQRGILARAVNYAGRARGVGRAGFPHKVPSGGSAQEMT